MKESRYIKTTESYRIHSIHRERKRNSFVWTDTSGADENRCKEASCLNNWSFPLKYLIFPPVAAAQAAVALHSINCHLMVYAWASFYSLLRTLWETGRGGSRTIFSTERTLSSSQLSGCVGFSLQNFRGTPNTVPAATSPRKRRSARASWHVSTGKPKRLSLNDYRCCSLWIIYKRDVYMASHVFYSSSFVLFGLSNGKYSSAL